MLKEIDKLGDGITMGIAGAAEADDVHMSIKPVDGECLKHNEVSFKACPSTIYQCSTHTEYTTNNFHVH